MVRPKTLVFIKDRGTLETFEIECTGVLTRKGLSTRQELKYLKKRISRHLTISQFLSLTRETIKIPKKRTVS